MKKSFILPLALLLFSACQTNETIETSFQQIRSQFQTPSAEYRPAPLWVWNTDVTTDDIDRMLLELKQQGFGGAFIHPRPGLVTEYLSDEWFRLWKYSLEKGEELGLQISIYDENSYPSGFAGGHVPDQMPESYNQGQVLVGQRTRTAPTPDDCYMCILRTGDDYREITDSLTHYAGREGDYYVYRLGYAQPSSWTAGFPYVDLLVKGVTEKFIDITMGGYEKSLGSALGTRVTMAFSDEPNIGCPIGGHCRWTPDLFECFQQMWGYSLRDKWPLLGEETGDWQKVRHDYNATLLHLFIERWSKPWHDYAERKHIQWTGHYWEHNWPDLSQGPDNMAMYAWHQIPGIDMLFNQYDDSRCQAQFGNVRSVKELRSVANQIGQRRTLSETYGGGGWDERFEDFKRLGDWEYALGVNFMNQHLSHMTITGARKFDYPPVFTSLSPWWQEYGVLNDYFARLSVVLSQGEQLNDWLILEPTTTLWLYYTHVAGGDPLWRTANAFQQFITRAEKAQMEYDLGSEDIIGRVGKVSGSRFCVGQRAYTTVVLPPEMVNLEATTFELLQHFVKKGGRLVCFALPTKIDGSDDDRLKALFDTAKHPNIILMQKAEEMLALYEAEAEATVKVRSGNDVYHQRRQYADGQLLFIANSSLSDTAQVDFSLPGQYLYRLDAMTGTIHLSTATGIALSPAGSALFFASAKELPDTMPERAEDTKGTTLQPLHEMRIEPLQQNALTLDFCDIRYDDARADALYYKEANSWLWSHAGMPDPWETAVQFRQDIVQRDTFSTGNVWVEYAFTLDATADASALRAIVERPDVWQVSLNGQTLSEWTTDTLLDHRCGVFSLSEAVKPGENRLTLHLERMNIMAELAPVIITGHFALRSLQRGFALTAATAPLSLGSWAEQGYPMYAWGMSYSTDIQADSPQGHRYTLRMGRWNGSVGQVFVGGRRAGIVIGQDDAIDLTPYMQEGTNTVEVRIYGSLKNLYGPHHYDANGLMGPGSWAGVREQWPGEKYRVIDYGMMEPFTIEVL